MFFMLDSVVTDELVTKVFDYSQEKNIYLESFVINNAQENKLSKECLRKIALIAPSPKEDQQPKEKEKRGCHCIIL